MQDIRVAISSPIDDNLYSLLVSHLCINEVGITVCGIITLKVFSLQRIRTEYKRQGRSLITNIMKKINVVFSLPSFMSNILESKESNKLSCLKDLKYLVFTGEPIPKNLTINSRHAIINISMTKVFKKKK